MRNTLHAKSVTTMDAKTLQWAGKTWDGPFTLEYTVYYLPCHHCLPLWERLAARGVQQTRKGE